MTRFVMLVRVVWRAVTLDRAGLQRLDWAAQSLHSTRPS